MSKIEIKKYDIIQNKQYNYHKLYVDGKCRFDDFANDVTGREESSLKSIYTMMEMYSSEMSFPKTKFNRIKGIKVDGNELTNIFEFKKDNIRVYLIKHKPNMYIILGGIKTKQKSDIKKINQLLNSIKAQIKKI